MINPTDLRVYEAESRCTWQKFRANYPPLVIALTRNQKGMVRALLPYLTQLENHTQEVSEQWNCAIEIHKKQTQHSKNFDFLSLIEVIEKEEILITPDELNSSIERKNMWIIKNKIQF